MLEYMYISTLTYGALLQDLLSKLALEITYLEMSGKRTLEDNRRLVKSKDKLDIACNAVNKYKTSLLESSGRSANPESLTKLYIELIDFIQK